MTATSRTATALLAAVLLAGCGSATASRPSTPAAPPAPPIVGTIIEKDADPAEAAKTKRVSERKRSCTGTGTKRRCTTKTVTSTKTIKPAKKADYDVTVQDAAGERHEIEVSKAEFDRLVVGQQYTAPQ